MEGEKRRGRKQIKTTKYKKEGKFKEEEDKLGSDDMRREGRGARK